MRDGCVNDMLPSFACLMIFGEFNNFYIVDWQLYSAP